MFMTIIHQFFHPCKCCQVVLEAFSIFAVGVWALLWLKYSTPISGQAFPFLVYVEIGQPCGMCYIIGTILVPSQHATFNFFLPFMIQFFNVCISFTEYLLIYSFLVFSFGTSDFLYNCLLLFKTVHYDIRIKLLCRFKVSAISQPSYTRNGDSNPDSCTGFVSLG